MEKAIDPCGPGSAWAKAYAPAAETQIDPEKFKAKYENKLKFVYPPDIRTGKSLPEQLHEKWKQQQRAIEVANNFNTPDIHGIPYWLD